MAMKRMTCSSGALHLQCQPQGHQECSQAALGETNSAFPVCIFPPAVHPRPRECQRAWQKGNGRQMRKSIQPSLARDARVDSQLRLLRFQRYVDRYGLAA